MSHLTDERIMAVLSTPDELTASESAHLDQCAPCRQSYDELAVLADDLAVAARSQPRAEVSLRYYQLFEQVHSQPTGLKARLRELVAALSWDSRQQLAMQGVRSVVASEYRLVYATAEAEVELMVEIDGTRRHLEGEILPLTAAALTPALLQLQSLDRASAAVLETEIGAGIDERVDDAGRFQFQDLEPGRYRLEVTTAFDQTIVIDELELT